MINCVFYCRAVEKEEIVIIEQQIEELSAKLYQMGERVIKQIVKESEQHIDPEEREGFTNILELAKNKEFSELWCISEGVISHDSDVLSYLKILLKKKGITIIFSDKLEESKQDEVEPSPEQISFQKYQKNRYKGMYNRIKEKKVMSRPPFGYVINDQGSLVVDESKRGLIRRLFSEFDDPFVSLSKLSKKYNLSVSILRNVRSNPIYKTGEVRWAGKIVYYVEPIVPENNNQHFEAE